jgi:hypothetical protein
MALNKTIVKKTREKTEGEPDIGNFLVKLLELESGSPGWFKSEYATILETSCKEEKKDANN